MQIVLDQHHTPFLLPAWLAFKTTWQDPKAPGGSDSATTTKNIYISEKLISLKLMTLPKCHRLSDFTYSLGFDRQLSPKLTKGNWSQNNCWKHLSCFQVHGSTKLHFCYNPPKMQMLFIPLAELVNQHKQGINCKWTTPSSQHCNYISQNMLI